MIIGNKRLVDIADLDVIFLTYDEPLKDQFWVKIKNMIPWARRVDGIQGSDAAHKAAAQASSTDRFVLIDGDNIPDSSFFGLQLEIDDANRDCVFRWKARNNINGLTYGNGGLSSWTRSFAERMRTHEASNGSADTMVEFCFDPKYWAMHDCYSITYPDQDPYHAWRAGFREGVKMCLDRGRRLDLLEFRERVAGRNMDNLSIWHNVGADVENGKYAMSGARYGTWKIMMDPGWDYTEVRDFDHLSRLWNEYDHARADEYAVDLQRKLGLDILELDATQSRFFKHHYARRRRNLGVMVRDQ